MKYDTYESLCWCNRVLSRIILRQKHFFLLLTSYNHTTLQISSISSLLSITASDPMLCSKVLGLCGFLLQDSGVYQDISKDPIEIKEILKGNKHIKHGVPMFPFNEYTKYWYNIASLVRQFSIKRPSRSFSNTPLKK
ncbi:hypothetical protein SAY86_024938 [Trapa natans]|uniref:Uncharacterized protein n=1 Tax=Trapa natans TaxID=22666 RepID=A0AAN7LZZ8_TRANT|nr:hypothetical protein SAY86_024938 [Trapa natans]